MPVKFQPCPTTGNGVHTWLLSQANRCRNGGLALELQLFFLFNAVALVFLGPGRYKLKN